MEKVHPLLAGRLALKRLYDQEVAPVMNRWQLTRMELDVLLFLVNNPQCCTAGEIVQLCALTKSHVSKAVERLTLLGLLTQQRDESNRRRIRLTLTEQAQPIVEDGIKAQRRFEEIINEGLDEADCEVFKRMMRRVAENVARALKS